MRLETTFSRRPTPTFALALAAEVTLIHFDFSSKHSLVFNRQFIDDDLAQAEKVKRGTFSIHAALALLAINKSQRWLALHR